MAPFIQDKDTLVFAPREKVMNGNIVVLKTVDGKIHLRRYYETRKTVRLVAFNPEHKAVEIDRSDIVYAYRAVELHRTLNENDKPFVRWQKKKNGA